MKTHFGGEQLKVESFLADAKVKVENDEDADRVRQ
jgi:hypothetical protein